MRKLANLAKMALCAGLACAATATQASETGMKSVTGTVFVIVMENQNWSAIKGSSSAPFINSLLTQPQTSFATDYNNPPGNHPSEPNYLWIEGGTNFGITTDNDPTRAANQVVGKNHLVKQLTAANITWKTYQENIPGTSCPLSSSGNYAAKHNPLVFFDDVTNDFKTNSAVCIAHVRPFGELASDLANNTVARYVFITPNLCDDMHNSCSPTNNKIKQGDNWLKTVVPMITSSAAYTNNGALFITWDEAASGDGPIGFIALSPKAKGNGYSNGLFYTHGSLLRSLEEIFGVSLLNDAAVEEDLEDLFQ
jgi:phosphatidylinositol-3-phosphatase